jgi:nitroimidazol reductase NimA-like FMN-containing flavoprotein (pyridoxamine 5'-phosphate oxidase superfamily)
MDTSRLPYADTRGLSDREVSELLRGHRVGVLALADEGTAYAIPLHYHYDGDVLLLRLSDDGQSRKLAYIETTTEPQFLVYGHDGPYESWSVLLTGTLRERDSDAEPIDAATLADWFGPMRVFDEAVEDLQVRLFEFRVERAVGRATIG